jgi:PAS domain S-box-containing protein
MARQLGITGSLSDRERQLLVMASEGFTDNAIAHKLGISLATVGTYWGRIRIKFGPLNRTELVAVFLKEQAGFALSAIREENQTLLRELDDRAKTELMLLTTLELFRGIMETAPDGIILVDENGTIQLANEQAEEIFGYGKNEMLGIKVDELVPDRYRENHVEHRQSYRENPVKRRMGEHLAIYAKRRDGSEFAMAAALSASETPSGMLVACIIRDLTETIRDIAKPLDAAD